MPSTAVYLAALPPSIALMAARLIFSGVSKSGSPAPSPMTSQPALLSARALSVTAMVADGLMRLSDCASRAMRISRRIAASFLLASPARGKAQACMAQIEGINGLATPEIVGCPHGARGPSHSRSPDLGNGCRRGRRRFGGCAHGRFSHCLEHLYGPGTRLRPSRNGRLLLFALAQRSSSRIGPFVHVAGDRVCRRGRSPFIHCGKRKCPPLRSLARCVRSRGGLRLEGAARLDERR